MTKKDTPELCLVKTIISDEKADKRYLVRAARLVGCVATENMTRESAINVLGSEISTDVIKAFRVLERLFTKLYYSHFEYVKNVFYKVVRPDDRDSTARTLSILQASIVSCIDYGEVAESLYIIAEEKLPKLKQKRSYLRFCFIRRYLFRYHPRRSLRESFWFLVYVF